MRRKIVCYIYPDIYNLCYISFISDVPSFLLVSFFFSPKNFSFFKSFSLIFSNVIICLGKVYTVWSSLSFLNLKCMSFTKFQKFGWNFKDTDVKPFDISPQVPEVLFIFFSLPPRPPPVFRLYNFYSSIFKFIDFLAFSILLLSPSSEFFILDIFSILKFVFGSSSFYFSTENLHIFINFKSMFTLPHRAWLRVAFKFLSDNSSI